MEPWSSDPTLKVDRDIVLSIHHEISLSLSCLIIPTYLKITMVWWCSVTILQLVVKLIEQVRCQQKQSLLWWASKNHIWAKLYDPCSYQQVTSLASLVQVEPDWFIKGHARMPVNERLCGLKHTSKSWVSPDELAHIYSIYSLSWSNVPSAITVTVQ